MKPQYIKAFAPATIANLSCGFDVLGLALEGLGDEVRVFFCDKPGVHIYKIEGDDGRLPMEAQKNTCSVGILSLLNTLGITDKGIGVELYKKLPLGSGMGSSAASAVAGIWAANALLGYPLKKEALLPFAMEAERIACGSAHADNVAPALLGGIVLIKGYDPLDVVMLPTTLPIYCVLLHPNIEVNTKDSRRVLPKEIPLSLAIKQWGNVGGVVAGFLKNDDLLLKRSLHDFIVEPSRAHLIPYFYEVKGMAIQKGALGCSISGSGPTIFALTLSQESAYEIAQGMSQVFKSYDIIHQYHVSKINMEGVKTI